MRNMRKSGRGAEPQRHRDTEQRDCRARLWNVEYKMISIHLNSCVPLCSFPFFCVLEVQPQNAGARKRPFILDGACSRRLLLVWWGFWGSPAAFVLDALALLAFSRLDFCDFAGFSSRRISGLAPDLGRAPNLGRAGGQSAAQLPLRMDGLVAEWIGAEH